MGGIRGDVRPDESNIDASAFPEFLVIELAAAVLELADHRLNGLAEGGVFAVGPVDAPLAGLRIVDAQGEALDVAGRAIGFEFLEIGATVPDFSRDRGAVELDPGRGAGQAILQAR